MGSSQIKIPDDWKTLLNLSQTLLNQPDAASLAREFATHVKEILSCESEVWLAEPSYPLPGEPEVNTIPSFPAPDLVIEALEQRQMTQAMIPVPENDLPGSGGKEMHEIAIPCATQDIPLAILQVWREIPFDSQEKQILHFLALQGAMALQVNRQMTLKNWRYDQLSLVRSVSAQIANITNLDDLCRRVTTLIQCSFGFYFVSIFTLDPGSDTLIFRASAKSCTYEENPPLFSVRLGEGIIGHVALTGEEHVTRDVRQDPLFRYIDGLPETRSEAVIPLMVENRVLGVLDLQSEKNIRFHENDMLVLHSLADSIAIAVESTRLYDNLERQADQLSAILDVNYALSSILDLEELLEQVVTLLQKQLGFPFIHIFTVHPGRRKVIYQAGTAKQSSSLKKRSFAFDLDAKRGMVPYVARTGKSLLANDVSKEPLYQPSRVPPHNTQSELDIPLNFGNEVLGVLDVQSDQLDAFDQEDVNLLEGFASGIAVAMRNANLFRSEQWRRRVADNFQEIASLLSTNLELSVVLDDILTKLEKTLPCDASAIWLLEDPDNVLSEQRPLQLAAVHGASRQRIVESRLESQSVRDWLDRAIDTSVPIIRSPGDPYGPLGAACGYPVNYSSIAAPLKAGDQVVGLLTLAHHAEGRYGSESTAITSTFATYAAVAIQNTKLFAKAQEDAWSSTVLLQVAEATQAIKNRDELLSTMVRLTPLLVGINQCAIFLHDEETESFVLRKWYGFHPDEGKTHFSEDSEIAFLKLAATQKVVFIDEPGSELGLTSLEVTPERGTVVLLPLVARGTLQGAFLVTHSSSSELGMDNPFDDETLALIQGIAQQTSVALENIQLLEMRQEEAYITEVLLQMAQAVVSQNDLDDILDTIVHLVPILVGVDTCIFYLVDKVNNTFEPHNVTSDSHSLEETIQARPLQAGEFALLDTILKSDTPLACPLDDPRLPFDQWLKLDACFSIEEMVTPLPSGKNHWLTGFPLSIKGEVFGIMVTREANVPREFHAKRIELLTGVAQQAALAIQNERLKSELVKRERIDQEIQLARQIQETFLPNKLPKVKGWDLAVRWRTAREVGGDFYDAFLTKNRELGISIADVADKGLPAALYMTVTRTLIRATSQAIKSPAKVLERVNELLFMDSQNGMFVTAIYAVLDPIKGTLTYANAGHNLPLLLRNASGKIETLPKGGIAMGVVKNAAYEEFTIPLKPGDELLLYTDGVTDAFSTSGEAFSETRLKTSLKMAKRTTSNQVLEDIEHSIDEFRKGEPPSDDLTMLLLRMKKTDDS